MVVDCLTGADAVEQESSEMIRGGSFSRRQGAYRLLARGSPPSHVYDELIGKISPLTKVMRC